LNTCINAVQNGRFKHELCILRQCLNNGVTMACTTLQYYFYWINIFYWIQISGIWYCNVLHVICDCIYCDI